MPKNETKDFIYKGKPLPFSINERLAAKQKVTEEQRATLAYLYFCMVRLMDDARGMNPETDKGRLRAVAQQVEDLEYQLQANWNFEPNENFHSYWYEIPHCQCPKLDNRDRLGYGQIINGSCPIHGH